MLSCSRHSSSIIGSQYRTILRSSISSVRFVFQITPSSHYVEKLIQTQKHNLQNSLHARKLPQKLETVINDWGSMTNARRTLEELESRKVKLSHTIRQLTSTGNASENHVSKLKEEARNNRNELKEVVKHLKLAEEKAISGFFALPNLLHPKTPLDSNQYSEQRVLSSGQERQSSYSEKYYDSVFRSLHSPASVYLKDGAAEAEADWIDSCARDWSAKGFLKIACPDIVKRTVLFGCGSPNPPEKLFSLRHDNEADGPGDEMVLVGGASLYALLAFLMRNVIEDPHPLRLYSIGRRYVPASFELSSHGEVSSNQDTAIQLLTTTDNCPDVMFDELTSMEATVSHQLTQLEIPFELRPSCAHELYPWEQYSSVIKVPLSRANGHVTIARFSIAGDYISRRLSVFAGPHKIPPGMVAAHVVPIVKHLLLV